MIAFFFLFLYSYSNHIIAMDKMGGQKIIRENFIFSMTHDGNTSNFTVEEHGRDEHRALAI